MVAFQLFITGIWSRQWRLIVNSTYSSRQNCTNYCLLKIFLLKSVDYWKKEKEEGEREKKRILHLSAYIIQPNCYRILYACKCLTSDFSIRWLVQVWLIPCEFQWWFCSWLLIWFGLIDLLGGMLWYGNWIILHLNVRLLEGGWPNMCVANKCHHLSGLAWQFLVPGHYQNWWLHWLLIIKMSVSQIHDIWMIYFVSQWVGGWEIRFPKSHGSYPDNVCKL